MMTAFLEYAMMNYLRRMIGTLPSVEWRKAMITAPEVTSGMIALGPMPVMSAFWGLMTERMAFLKQMSSMILSLELESVAAGVLWVICWM